jgi:hypothetical protein
MMTALDNENVNASTTLAIRSAKTAMRGLLFSLIALASSTALGAPREDAFYDCVGGVQAQYQLDLALCSARLAEQRDICRAEAAQRYASGMTACAVTASKASAIRVQVTPAPKQSLDTAFIRRLR